MMTEQKNLFERFVTRLDALPTRLKQWGSSLPRTIVVMAGIIIVSVAADLAYHGYVLWAATLTGTTLSIVMARMGWGKFRDLFFMIGMMGCAILLIDYVLNGMPH
jgi:hypothetical protein